MAISIRNEKAPQRVSKFWSRISRGGYPGGRLGKNFGQALEILEKKQAFLGRHSVGVWIGGVWNGRFQSPKIFLRGRSFQENLQNFAERAIFCQISGSGFQISEPEKNAIPHPQPFHTPTI